MLTRRLRWRIVAAVAIGVTATVNFNSFLSLLSFRSAITPTLQAQAAPAIDASLLSGLRWRSIGPARGGRSIAVAGSASRPNEYYFGATGGGLWKTTDGGVTWRPVSDGFFKSSSVGAVAVSESKPDVVYAGMGESSCAATSSRATASTSRPMPARRGRTSASRRRMADRRIRVHPANPDIVYVAALGDPYGPNRGARRLQDRPTAARPGEACSSATTRPARSISSMDPKNPDVLYAGFWEVFRTPHSLSSGGPGSGLFKSTDGGKTWTELTKNAGPAGATLGQGRRRRSRAPTPAASTRSSKPPTAASSCRTTPARPGSGQRRSPAAPARLLLHPHLRRPEGARTRSTSSTPGSTARPTPARRCAAIRVPHGDNHDLWIAAERSDADDQQQRRRRQRVDQRRRDLDRSGLSDRAVLQRLHDRARAVSRLRRAAGQHDRLRAQHR